MKKYFRVFGATENTHAGFGVIPFDSPFDKGVWCRVENNFFDGAPNFAADGLDLGDQLNYFGLIW